jgi:hypothetical protein
MSCCCHVCPADAPFKVSFGGRSWWYREAAVKLADDAAATSTASDAAPTSQWRVQAMTRVYCSLPGVDADGPLCTHGDIVREDHWSCCGGLVYQAPCTKVRVHLGLRV